MPTDPSNREHAPPQCGERHPMVPSIRCGRDSRHGGPHGAGHHSWTDSGSNLTSDHYPDHVDAAVEAVWSTENEFGASLRLLMLEATPADLVEAAKVLTPAMRGAWAEALKSFDIDLESREVKQLQQKLKAWKKRAQKHARQVDHLQKQLKMDDGVITDAGF